MCLQEKVFLIGVQESLGYSRVGILSYVKGMYVFPVRPLSCVIEYSKGGCQVLLFYIGNSIFGRE